MLISWTTSLGPFVTEIALYETRTPNSVGFASLDLQKVRTGKVKLSFEDKLLSLEWSDEPNDLRVTKNGVQHDWSNHAAYLYRSPNEESAPITSKWGEGALQVRSTNYVFECQVGSDGRVKFTNVEKP